VSTLAGTRRQRGHTTPAGAVAGGKLARRDQGHASAGLTPLRFTDEQIDFEQAHVVSTLRAVARLLGA
jgi:hypothetical protein